MAAQNNSFITSPFPNSISHKLDYSTFLLWRQQVEPVIKSHQLQRFVANPLILVCFLSEADWAAGIENPSYEVWEKQDQVLLTWLQSTLSMSILSSYRMCSLLWRLGENSWLLSQANTSSSATIAQWIASDDARRKIDARVFDANQNNFWLSPRLEVQSCFKSMLTQFSKVFHRILTRLFQSLKVSSKPYQLRRLKPSFGSWSLPEQVQQAITLLFSFD